MFRVVGIALAFCGLTLFISCTTGAPLTPPRYDHVVIAIEENKDASEVQGYPYISSLAAWGTSLTQMYALVHPSQPNYIALFSGSTQGVADDGTYDLTASNLCTSLLSKGLTYLSYSEDLPTGDPRLAPLPGIYARKHNPAASFTNVPELGTQDVHRFPRDVRRSAYRELCDPESRQRHARWDHRHGRRLAQDESRCLRAMVAIAQ